MPGIGVGGERLHYRIQGDRARTGGPALVLIHGAGGNLMHWPAALRRAPGQLVCALDLPGHGRSGGRGRTAIAAYAEVVREFGRALGLTPYVFCGHSMGGAIGLELALRYPAELAGLVLVSSGARLRVAPQLLQGILTDFDATVELLAAWAHGEHVNANTLQVYRRRLREVDPLIAHGDFLACDAFDRRADLAGLALPTLVICGEADQMTPVKYSRYLAEHIRGAELVIVPGGGHMVMVEQSAVVTAAVEQLLRKLP